MDKKSVREEMEKFSKSLPKFENVKKAKKKTVRVKEEKHVDYFEGELQLRGVDKEILNYVFKRIEKEGARIPDSKEFGEGNYNFKITSKKTARKIGAELKKKFGGELTESAKLFTRDHLTQKEVHRLNVYFKKFPVNVGDYVEYNKGAYKITGFATGKAKVLNITTGKSTQALVKSLKKLDKHKCQVVQVQPEVYVLDEDFQNIKVVNGEGLKLNQKIKCVFLKDKAISI